MIKKILIIILILFFYGHLFAQNKTKTDSLFVLLKTTNTDTTRVNLYASLSWIYKAENQDTALYFASLGIQLATDINFKKGLSKCYYNTGVIYYLHNNYNTALQYYLKSIKIDEELGDKDGISDCYSNIGLVHADLGNYNKAIDNYLKSLKLYEEIGDKKGISGCYGNIGNIHYFQGNYDKALEYYLKTLKNEEEIGNKNGMAKCYSNIGLVLSNKGNYNEAIENYLKSIIIEEELGDKMGIAASYNNIGVAQLDKGDYEKALENYLVSLKINEEINDKNGISLVLGNLSELHIFIADSVATFQADKIKHYKEAVNFGLKAINIAKEISAFPMENVAAKTLMNGYKKLGNFEKAAEYAEIFIATKDSMFKEEKTKAITEMETKYQSEKKQLEIEKLGKEKDLQTSEMKKQRLIIMFVICGLLFVLGFSVVLFRLFIQKKKANKIITEKNESLQVAYEEINTQKEEIIVQRDNIQEQKEIIEEHQKEIHDSINYAKRIQQAVLPELELLLTADKQTSDLSTVVERVETPVTDYFVFFKPKDIVSGDFYWSTRIGNILIITVADCTGHGVPGAFMSMLGISFLNEIVRNKEVTKASEVLDQLRTSIIDALKQKGESGEQKDGMDISFCAINLNTLEMQFAGANNPCWIITNRQSAISSSQSSAFNLSSHPEPVEGLFQLHELKGDKMPIGIHTNMQPFTNQIYQLQKGDTIYLMSDGYEDQFGGPNRKKFFSKNLKNLLTANSQKPMALQKQTLETTITDWIGNAEQIDDITLMGLKI